MSSFFSQYSPILQTKKHQVKAIQLLKCTNNNKNKKCINNKKGDKVIVVVDNVCVIMVILTPLIVSNALFAEAIIELTENKITNFIKMFM